MSKLKQKAEKYLQDHPGAEVHGVVNDPNAFLFLRKQDATVHAVTLGTTEVESFGSPASHIEVNDAPTSSGNQLNEQELAERNAEAEKKAEAKAKAKADADKKAEAEAEAKAKAAAEAKATEEAEEKALADAEAKAQAEAEAKAKVETEAEKPAPKKTKKTTAKK